MKKNALGINKKEINKLAFKTKSSVRIPDKLWADKLVEAFCMSSIHDEASLMNICAYLYENYGIDISKQGLHKRIEKNGTVELFKEIVIACFLKSLNNDKKKLHLLRAKFDRILLQDSTIVQLPNKLFITFFGIKASVAITTFSRIQFVYDILNNNFITFSIDAYNENDLASASKIDVIGKDLWLRDRGYFSLDACIKIANEGGDFILRYKAYTTLFQKDANGKITKLDLMEELKQNPYLKIKVLVGENKVPMLLVVAPADEQIADERRRKAKKKYRYGSESKSNSKPNMTPEYYFLCGFTIFLTSITLNLDFKEIFALYSLRWRIEIIFKTWKSHLNFENIHNVSENQFYILIYCRFIMNQFIYSKFYNFFLEHVLTKHNKIISIIALTKHLMLDFKKNLKDLNDGKIDYLTDKFSKFCTYGKRKRKNYFEMEQEIFGALDSMNLN